MKQSITIIFTFLFLTSSYSQKLFDNYRTLKNPKNDSEIIGKIFKKGFYTGEGTKAYKEYVGLTKFTSIDSTEAKAKIEASVSKVVSGTINLSNTKAQTSNFDDIKILECSNLSEIKFTGGKGDYVIGVITVGSFDVKIGKEFDASLKAELEKEVAEKFNVKPDITYNKKRAQVRLGGKLVVAQKLLRVKKYKYYIENINITSNNKKEWNDKLTKADNSLKFESINTIESNMISDKKVKDHLGCIALEFINSSLPNPNSNDPLSREIIVCPRCSQMTSEIKPECNGYNPSTDYKNISQKRIATGMTNDYVVFYSVTIDDLRVAYEKSPREGIIGDNYKLDNATAKIKVRKNVYYYRIK